MTETTRVISADVLREFVAKLFEQSGMSPEDSAYCGYALVQTNIWGIDSRGVLRARIYLERLFSGAVNPTPETKSIRGDLALEVIDGDDGMGFVVGKSAMSRASELAQPGRMPAWQQRRA